MSEYQHHEGEAIQRTKPKIWDPRYYYLNQLKRLVHKGFLIVKPQNSSSLLDYGCGAMPYKQELSHLNLTYSGADLIENKLADILVSPDGKIQNADEKFDIVFSTQVLEHVPDYAFYLSEAKRCLAEDGYVILTTHGYWMYHPDPTDYWRWTSMGLKKIVEDAGFKIVHFEGIIGRSAMGLQLFQDGLMFKLPKIVRFFFILCCQLGIALFDKVNNQQQKSDDACTYLVIAKHA